MTIYLDAIFLLNILFNFLILLLVQLLTQHATNRWRIFFGAFVATLIVPLSIYYPNSFFTTITGKLIFSIIIIISSFKLFTFQQFIKLFLSFYFISFSLGGGLIAVHFLMNHSFSMTSQGFLTYRTGFGDITSWLFVLVGFPLVWLFTKLRMDGHMVDQIRYNETYSVAIDMKGKRCETNGFIDSGNQLVDPVTNAPVIICDHIFLRQFFKDDEWDVLQKAYETLDVDLIPSYWKKRTFIVPFKGVGGSGNILFTLKPDLLTIYYGEQKLVTKNVLIGVQFSELTSDRHFHCLLHPKIIQTATAKLA